MKDQLILGDSYKELKKLPDKSVDLVYIDIPYLIEDGGCSQTPLAKRIKNINYVELANIRNGIDYSIFEELCRIMKHIYIYMV